MRQQTKRHLPLLVVVSLTILFATLGGGQQRLAEANILSGLQAAWQQKLPTASRAVSSTSVHNQLFVGTRSHGVFRSGDAGGSWVSDSGGLGNLDVEAMAGCSSSGLVFAGTWGGGIFRRPVASGSWEQRNSGLTESFITALACGDGSTLYAGSASNGVFRSVNNGDQWSRVITGLTNQQIWGLRFDGNLLYAGTNSGVAVSTDQGASWQMQGLSGLAVYTFWADESSLWAGTSNGLYKSNKTLPLQWQRLDGLNQTVYGLVRDSSGYLYVGTADDQVYRLEMDGKTLVKYSEGLSSSRVYRLESVGQRLIAAMDNGVWINDALAPPHTPTFTHTPTDTPTLTTTPTPTPAFTPTTAVIAQLSMISEDLTEAPPIIGYQLAYEIIGSAPARNVRFESTVPDNAEYVGPAIPTAILTNGNRTLQWVFSEKAASTQGEIYYFVQVHTPTPTSTPTATPPPTVPPGPSLGSARTVVSLTYPIEIVHPPVAAQWTITDEITATTKTNSLQLIIYSGGRIVTIAENALARFLPLMFRLPAQSGATGR